MRTAEKEFLFLSNSDNNFDDVFGSVQFQSKRISNANMLTIMYAKGKDRAFEKTLKALMCIMISITRSVQGIHMRECGQSINYLKYILCNYVTASKRAIFQFL